MSKEKVPIKIVVPIIVVTWVLSLISALAIVYMMPSLIPIRSEQIGEGLITSDKIADEAIITVKLADGNVTSAKILDGNITAVDIADSSIITVKISDGNVTTNKIADGNVTTNKIADYAIVEIKLADGNVTTAKIKDGDVKAEDLATGSVWSAEIRDGEVRTIDIADYAVTNIKLAANAVPFAYESAIFMDLTTSTTWDELDYMSVTIGLHRTSHLLIMFSCDARNGHSDYAILVRALVGGSPAFPNVARLTPAVVTSQCTYTQIFYRLNVAEGKYTVEMEWKVTGSTGTAYDRTLAVIALPA